MSIDSGCRAHLRGLYLMRLSVTLGVFATLAFGGCSPSGGTTAPKTPSTTGSLAVTVTAPAGVTPAVIVNGPSGFHINLNATRTLTGLEPGTYAIAAPPVVTTNPVVGTMNRAAVTGNPATVTAGGTAVATAAYAQVPGSGGLWAAQYVSPSSAVQFTAGQLGSSTSAAPAVAMSTGDIREVGAAFDRSGNLWVARMEDSAIVEYTAAQLASSGKPTPAVMLRTTSFYLPMKAPAGLAFDFNGNLWVADNGGAVEEFTPSQLASSGRPVPAGFLEKSLPGPTALAFDGSGNLWVVDAASNSLVEFAANTLLSLGNPDPLTIVSDSAGSLAHPLGLAFDQSGNLWVANGAVGVNTVVEFTASQLAAGGNQSASVTLSANGASLVLPTGLAFDASGDLWVANLNGPSIVEFTPSQLGASGNPTPQVVLSSVIAPWGLAFDPHATGLPLP